MINKHIEIVSSNKSWLSSMGLESREAILTVLSRHYTKVGITIITNLRDLEDLVNLKPDLVFLGMKFMVIDQTLGLRDPNKIWISQYLEQHGIAYTGSGQVAHELEYNKPLAKQRVIDGALSTPSFYIARQNEKQNREDMNLRFPVFIKPTNRGGGFGIDDQSVAHNFSELESKIRSIDIDLQSDSLVEEYLDGREFSVAILKDLTSQKLMAMPIELIPEPNSRGRRILSSQVKTANSEVVLEVTDKLMRSTINELAINVFNSLGARDYGRVDIRLDSLGTPHFLEANLIPSLVSGYGSFPKACLINLNLDYEQMILNIVELGLSRAGSITEIIIDPDEVEEGIFDVRETALEPA